jgi:hypothetical protein
MTLEAVIILPLVAGFFVAILFFFRVMQVELSVQKSLDDTARRMAVYLADDGDTGNVSAANLGKIKAQFLTEIREYDTVDKYVTGGRWGIILSGSSTTSTVVHLVAEYAMSPPVKLVPTQGLVVVQSAESRKWNGYAAENAASGGDNYVYMTAYGTVYHTDRSCTYLNPSIKMAAATSLETLSNKYGRKYRKCESCAKSGATGGILYVTEDGECYHNDLGCSGLKRTINIVLKSEVGDTPCCNKCKVGGGS